MMVKKYAVLCCFVLAACASPVQRSVLSTPSQSTLILPMSLSSQSGVSLDALNGIKMTPTITSLLERALSQYEAKELEAAGATVERALRISPRDPTLWYFLSRIRYVQKNMEQAVQLALRSNSMAKKNAHLMVLNWRTVAAAREEQGDEKGVKKALSKAQFYESGR